MKKKRFITGVIIIVAVLTVISTPGTYYSTPEAALMNWDFNNSACGKIVDTAWMREEPVIFYVTKYGDFCCGQFQKTIIFGKTGWKMITSLRSKISNLNPLATVPGRMGTPKHTNNDEPNQVLFGVTKSDKADTIRINEKTPILKSFEIEGQTYTLRYMVCSDELKYDKVNVTSD